MKNLFIIILIILFTFSVNAKKRESLFDTYRKLKAKNNSSKLQYKNYISKGKIHLKKADIKNALICFNMALKYKKTSEIYNLIGMCYEANKKYLNAVSQYEKAISLNKNNITAANNLGFLLVKENIDLKKGLSFCYFAYKKNPSSKHIIDSTGFAFFKNKRYKSAIYKFRDSLRIDPNFFPSIFHLAQLYYEINEKKLSLTFAKQAKKIRPDSKEVNKLLSNLGIIKKNILKKRIPITKIKPIKMINHNNNTNLPENNNIIFRRIKFLDSIDTNRKKISNNYNNAVKYYNNKDFIVAKPLFINILTNENETDEYRSRAAKYLALIATHDNDLIQANKFFKKAKEFSFYQNINDLSSEKDKSKIKKILNNIIELNIDPDLTKIANEKILFIGNKISFIKPISQLIYIEIIPINNSLKNSLDKVLYSEIDELIKDNKYSETLHYFDNITETNSIVQYNRGICELISGNYNNAIIFLTKSYSENNDNSFVKKCKHLINCITLYKL